MKKLKLYPVVTDIGENYSKVKVVTLPNQNLTLRDIIKRFLRREQLPVGRDATYVENMGDLEKLAHADLTIQHDRVIQLRDYIANAKKRMDDLKAAKDAADSKSTPPSVVQGGVVPADAGVRSPNPADGGKGAS